MPHAELASAKDSHSKVAEEAEDTQGAAKRFLPFSTGESLQSLPLVLRWAAWR